MNPEAVKEFVIVGVTQDGKTFRPTDWAERLAWDFCVGFARDNKLRTEPGRDQHRE